MHSINTNTEYIEPIAIIGIAVITTNKDGQAGKDIGSLWQRFFADSVMEKIPQKISDEIIAVYTEYESDFMGEYMAIVGCKVSDLSVIPDGYVGKNIGGGTYVKYSPQGKIPDIIVQQWEEIWSSKMPRAYTTDFEVYGENAQNPDDAQVDIYVAIG